MLDSERQRMIDRLSGAELEIWDRLGFEMTDKMRAKLKEWQVVHEAQAGARKRELELRRKLLEQADQAAHVREVKKKTSQSKPKSRPAAVRRKAAA